ncbi:MAG TPA: 3-oxoacyl-ACP reductase FabG, partial [Acidimicrobiales bacterium]|nr:3-oxoacyl-ACP reductase FabG [Acidimicrobiales bacterium]
MSGRVVLVTGGTRGIGRATADAFVAQGDQVAVTYRKEPVEGFTNVRCDVTSADDVRLAFAEVEERLGPVEVLVANAGITQDGLVLQLTEEAFTAVLDANLVGTFRCVRQAVPRMIRARRGRIVLVSSVVAMMGSAGQTNYAASKAGLVGFARSLAREIGSRSVTVNVVAPGFVDTELTRVLPEERRQALLDHVPLRRLGKVNDVAGVIAWLASDAAAYVTGAVIPVDGGLG